MENLICNECKKEFTEYSVIEKGMMAGTPYKGVDICQDCMALGWTDDPKEVADGIRNDPELGGLINRESPYFKK